MAGYYACGAFIFFIYLFFIIIFFFFFTETFVIAIIKALQALHHAPPLHLHQANAINLSKRKSSNGALVFP